MPFSTRLKIDLAFGIALLILAATALASYRGVQRLQAEQEGVVHAERVLRAMGEVLSQLKDVESGQRGYLLTRQERFLDPYVNSVPRIDDSFAELRVLLRDSAQARDLGRLESLVAPRLAFAREVVALGRAGDFEGAEEMVSSGRGKALMDEIRALASGMEAREFERLRARQEGEAATARRTITIVLLANTLGIVLLGASRTRMVRELQAREQAERELRESEQRFRRLTEASLEGIVLSEGGRIVDASPAFAKKFGYPLDELVGRELTGLAAPESREVVAEHVRAGFEESYEAVGLRADGSRFFIELRGRGTTYRGRPARVTAVRDVTGRKRAEQVMLESEQRFRSLVETASDMIYRADTTGCFTYVNPTAVQIMGYPAEELVGMHYTDLIREDAREAAVAFYGAQVEAGEQTTYYEFPAVTADGREVWVGQNVALLYENDEIVGFQAVARDITRRREVERLKDEFLSVVSHELRTPLTAIRGSLGLLASGRMGALEERGQRMLEIAAQNTDRLVRLINDLLDIDRIESGEASMEKVPVVAAELMQRAADAIHPMAEKAGVTVQVEAFEARLSADPDRIDQVLTNLLANAIKFSPEGASVVLGGERGREEAVFWVKDSGRGIPSDKLESVFERFQQVDSTDSRQKGGTGLGLPISRSIVQQHGGRMWVESAWGQGSTFFFSLPLPGTAAEPRAEDHTPLVLVVEDDPAVGAVVRKLLEREGYRVLVVERGEDAVPVARQRQPAAILLDLSLPGMSGGDVITALRQLGETRRIPVVVLTGAGEDTGLELAEIVGWVQKPFDRETLLKTVHWAVTSADDRCHVLLVEGNEDLAGVIREQLTVRGLKCFFARTGREAIEMSRRLRYDLLVLDPGLPDVDGFEVVDWLRRHNRHRNVPVLVYTARELDDSERDRLRLGPTEFLVKARVATDQLEERIVAMLEIFRNYQL